MKALSLLLFILITPCANCLVALASSAPCQLDQPSTLRSFRVRPGLKGTISYLTLPRPCPREGECSWKLESQARDGDVVMAGAKTLGFRCVKGRKSDETEIVGYLPDTHLAAME